MKDNEKNISLLPDLSRDDLLTNSMADLDETYKQYKDLQMKIRTEEFLENSYMSMDINYKTMTAPLSLAYLSSSDWYCGYSFPVELFDLILMVGLVHNACSLALQTSSDPRLKKYMAMSLKLDIDQVD
jgi:hypothetical protein